jgi:hypothetical protein
VSALELGFIILVGLVVALGSTVSIYVLARAYFGGRHSFGPPPPARGGSPSP